MKTIAKYKTFEELNAAEKATTNVAASLKKHASYESTISKIYSAKTAKQTALKRATLNGR